MKVSVNWLKKYTKINVPGDELARRIGAQLGAVEETKNLAAAYAGIKIVEITQAAPHPSADRLSLYRMNDGERDVQVISGDQSLQVGDKVGWIAPGQTVPSTFGSGSPVVMEVRSLRGELSHGMFGSGRELGLNDNHEDVLKLDTDRPAGTLLAEAYELDDYIIDIENKMFTHRPDGFGLLGVAREIAGIQGEQFTSPEWYMHEAHRVHASGEPLRVQVENQIPELVPNYQVAAIRGVRIGQSSLITQSYLMRVGIRPINNVVDVTNYLMYLTAQPLHAFDYDKVARLDDAKSVKIIVRHPKSGETLRLLDGRTIELPSDAMLIASRHKPLALGGMIGGSESEVDAQTTNVLLESANFNMYAIRRSSMQRGIFTDAVTRFSKGQSKEQCGVVLAQAIELMQLWAGGVLASDVELPRSHAGQPIRTNARFINERLGTRLRSAEIESLLSKVEFGVSHHDDELSITPPFWRTDLELPEDIVEEVGRLRGYATLPHELPLRPTRAVTIEPLEALKQRVRQVLVAAGSNELQTYSFVSSKLFAWTGQDAAAAYRLRNAISPELELVRTNVLPSLIEKVHMNHKIGFGQFGLFEIGKSHNKHEVEEDELPHEHLNLSYLFSADRKEAAQYAGAPFYVAKHQLAFLLERLRVADVAYVPLSSATLQAWWLKNLAVLFEPERAALVSRADQPIGIIGEFKPAIRRAFKLPECIAGFELDLGVLRDGLDTIPVYQPLSRYPATDQDVCFRVANDVSYTELEALIRGELQTDHRLRVSIAPVDIFQREEDSAHKQITYRLTLQHHDRTLTTDEVNQLIGRIVVQAQDRFAAAQI